LKDPVLSDFVDKDLACPEAHFRVRLRNADGSRTRAVDVEAPSRDAAADVALADDPGDWEVLEVKRIPPSAADSTLCGSDGVDLDDMQPDPLLGDAADESAEVELGDDDLPTPSEPLHAGRWDPDPPYRDGSEALAEPRVQVPEDDMAHRIGDEEHPRTSERSSARCFRVQIARGATSSGALVWETSLRSDSMESALTTVRSGIDSSWEVISVSCDDA